jgi:hypothetical protein
MIQYIVRFRAAADALILILFIKFGQSPIYEE